MFAEFPDVLCVPDLCEMLGIGIVLAYKLVKDKTIKSRKIGREYKILKTDVISYLQNQTKGSGNL